jgi:hypothetical protein
MFNDKELFMNMDCKGSSCDLYESTHQSYYYNGQWARMVGCHHYVWRNCYRFNPDPDNKKAVEKKEAANYCVEQHMYAMRDMCTSRRIDAV